MNSELKDGWRSIVPLHTRSELATGCYAFPKIKSSNYGSGDTPVYLNVYDLSCINDCIYWAGFGVFHSGIEVHGVEYAFGAHEYPTSGVFEVEPRKCPGYRFRRSIFMGTTHLNRDQVREFMEHQSANYNGDAYQLVVKNCNHFCADMCYRLTGNQIPKWVNRLARIGSYCNSILPEAVRASTIIRHGRNRQDTDCEKKSLRRSLSCFSSISKHHKERRQVSISSLFLHSHYKGCLPPWELKNSQVNR